MQLGELRVFRNSVSKTGVSSSSCGLWCAAHQPNVRCPEPPLAALTSPECDWDRWPSLPELCGQHPGDCRCPSAGRTLRAFRAERAHTLTFKIRSDAGGSVRPEELLRSPDQSQLNLVSKFAPAAASALGALPGAPALRGRAASALPATSGCRRARTAANKLVTEGK